MSPDEVITMYVLRGSSDQTEGRGGTVDRESFTTLEDALECNASGRWGVMGAKNDCDIVVRRLFIDASGTKWQTDDQKIFGYHKAVNGKWVRGFLDDRDLPEVNDPEFAEYLRLKKRFEK